jgi:hypothetical protein
MTGYPKKLSPKNFGDAHRVPNFVAWQQISSASCCFSSLLSSWLPWIYSPFPFVMESCNGRLLQLIDCIDSQLNEVKRKMIETSRAIVHHSHCTQRTQENIGEAIVSGACEHSLSTRLRLAAARPALHSF